MPEHIKEAKLFIPNAKTFLIPNTVPQYTNQSTLVNPVIIHVGRISNVKRQHLVVEAFAKLKNIFPEWKIEFWGSYDSEYATKLKTRIRELELQEKVLFCGTTTNVKEKLSAASIFVFPSKFEGFGLALAEAMSMGLPSIGCKNCPSVNTLIRDGENGFLCEDNPDDLAQKMQLLMQDLTLRSKLGTVAKQDMRQFSEEIILNKWEQLLNKVRN